jgi:hypothetical protein
MPFRPGDTVEFTYLDSGKVTHAQYVHRIDDRYSEVRDGTGRPPRVIRTARLRRAVAGYPPLVA